MNLILQGCLSLAMLLIASGLTAVLYISFDSKGKGDVEITGSDIISTALPIFTVLLILKLLELWIDRDMRS